MEITSRGRLEMSFGAAAVSMRVTEVIVDGKVRVVCASCARAPCLCCLAPQEISRKDVFSSDVTISLGMSNENEAKGPYG